MRHVYRIVEEFAGTRFPNTIIIILYFERHVPTKMKLFNWLIAFAAGVGGFLFGYEIGIIK